ncbi:MAG: hypothetical protein ACRD4J_13105 [Nitrososphaeraceae archaeon]
MQTMRILRNTRRIDTNLFKKVRLSLQEDNKEKAAGLHTEDEQYRIDRHERIVICNNDNLMYNTMHVLKRYPDTTEFYLEHSASELLKVSVAEVLSPYIERHYLCNEVLFHVKYAMELGDIWRQ